MADTAVHELCDSCFTRKGHARNHSGGDRVCCPIVSCPNAGCTFQPHVCKVDEHARLVCLFQRVPCVNACNGCSWKLRRGDMHLHLASCPASVVRCMAEWNRWPLLAPNEVAIRARDDDDDLCHAGIPSDATDDRMILRSATSNDASTDTFTNACASSAAAQYLDVALMNRDQRMLNASLKIPLKLKSALRNNIIRKHPAAPVETPLIWGTSDNAVSAQSSSTIVRSDDDPSASWNEAHSPPRLQRSLVEGTLFSRVDDNHNRTNNDGATAVTSSIPSISLGCLYRFLLSLANDFPDIDSLLGVETENVGEILLNVEKNASRVSEIVDGVLEDLVVYPKKIAEQLVDVASDLDEWAEDLEERVAPNLRIVANKLKHLWVIGAIDGGSFFEDNGVVSSSDVPSTNNAESASSILDAISTGVAHVAAYRRLSEAKSTMRLMAAELQKADKFTAGTRPRRIARNLRVHVVTPLKVLTGEFEENGNSVGVEDALEPEVDWGFVDERVEEGSYNGFDVVVDSSRVEGLVDGLSLEEEMSKKDARNDSIGGLNFGLAGLQQLAASYATPMVEQTESKKASSMTTTTTNSTLQTGISSHPTSRPRRQTIVRLKKEMLMRSQPKPKDMFTFLCAQDFRRDEFENHARVVHDIVDSGLGGWVERRCPLARLGCPFVVRPLAPCTDSGQIIFDSHLNAFGVKVQAHQRQIPQRQHSSRIDSLQALPPELLEVIFRKLDGFSLNHVSRTCKFFRDVCFGLLEEKGLVLPVWKRISKGSLDMTAAWRVSHHRWFFSNNATADKWLLTDDSFKMNEHLERCSFNERKAADEKVLVMSKAMLMEVKGKEQERNKRRLLSNFFSPLLKFSRS